MPKISAELIICKTPDKLKVVLVIVEATPWGKKLRIFVTLFGDVWDWQIYRYFRYFWVVSAGLNFEVKLCSILGNFKLKIAKIGRDSTYITSEILGELKYWKQYSFDNKESSSTQLFITLGLISSYQKSKRGHTRSFKGCESPKESPTTGSADGFSSGAFLFANCWLVRGLSKLKAFLIVITKGYYTKGYKIC